MSTPTFYWHDYETWGTSPKWDRASQFAGIRTDWELNVIGKPLVMYCQPADDMLPHPEACLITGITPQQARSEGLCEAEFFQEVNKAFSQPGTCGVGYNSLRFDDEFTRYGFYRNFIDPYAREWQNGNSRWDLIDVVRLTRALRPEGIEWPEREPGVPSFRLEVLTEANGISHESAHDALSDVYATIEMARLIKNKQPRLFEFCLNLRKKTEAAKYLNSIEQKPVLHVSRMIPARLGCISPVLPLMPHPTNKNSVIVYDLRHNPEDLLQLDIDAIQQRLFVASEDLPEGVERIALKEIHINKSPVLSPLSTLTDEAADEWQIDQVAMRSYADMLRSSKQLQNKIRAIFSQNHFQPETDPDGMLYDGFINNGDKKLCEQVLNTSVEDLGSLSNAFQDPRLPELLFRYRARNWPGSLTVQEKSRWQAFCRDRLNDVDGKTGINLKNYGQKLAQLAIDPETSEHDKAIIDALLDWPAVIQPGQPEQTVQETND
jgi:exodeoxyribonuclease I